MLPILQIGPVAIPVPAVVILIGLWIGISITERLAIYYAINPNHLTNLILISLITGFLAARILYIVQYSATFQKNPLDIFSRNFGLLNPSGGIAAGLIAGLIYGQRKSMPFWRTLDALTPGLATLSIALGVSQLASGSAFGSQSELPWSIELWGASRHPTQIYTIIASTLILWIVLPSRSIWKNRPSGVQFLAYVGFLSFSRIITEAFRGDSPLTLYGLRTPQLTAWLFLGISLISIGFRMRTNNNTDLTIGKPSS